MVLFLFSQAFTTEVDEVVETDAAGCLRVRTLVAFRSVKFDTSYFQRSMGHTDEAS